MTPAEKAAAFRLERARYYFRECKERGVKFKERNLHRLLENISVKKFFHGNGKLSMAVLNFHMGYLYHFAIRIKPDESDVEQYNILEEALFRKNPLLESLPKVEMMGGMIRLPLGS